MGEWEGIRSGHSNMHLVRERLKLNMLFSFFAVTTIMLWWMSIFMFVHDHCAILFKASDTLWFETVFSWWRRFCQMVCCVICVCSSEVIDNVLASVQLKENDKLLFENGKLNIQEHLLSFLFPFLVSPYPKCYSLTTEFRHRMLSRQAWLEIL